MGKRAIDELSGQTDARRGCLEPGQCFKILGLVAVENQTWFLDESPAGGYLRVDVTSFSAAWTRWNS
jgi:hypothetical protein